MMFIMMLSLVTSALSSARQLLSAQPKLAGFLCNALLSTSCCLQLENCFPQHIYNLHDASDHFGVGDLFLRIFYCNKLTYTLVLQRLFMIDIHNFNLT